MAVFRLKFSTDQVVLSAAFLIFSASTILWTVRDKTPPPWDPSDHMIAAYDYFRPLARGRFSDFGSEFFTGTHYYAPLVHLGTSAFFLLFGASRLTGIAINLASLAVLMASVWWLANRLYCDEPADRPDKAQATKTDQRAMALPTTSETSGHPANGTDRRLLTAGAFAAVLVASYHFPAWLLHDAFLDFPLMAIVALSFALLVNAGDFRNWRSAALFGVSAGLGLLSKQTFPFFFALPAAYLVGRALLKRDLRALANLGLAGLVALSIAAIWYIPHLKHVIAIYRTNQMAAIDEGEAPLFSFASNVVYLHGLISYQIQVIFGIVFLVGLVFSLIRYRRESVMLYLWIASGIVSFTLIANKDMRYTIPILPAVAVISAAWIGSKGVEIRPWRIFKTTISENEAAASYHDQSVSAPEPRRAGLRRSTVLKSTASVALLGWALVSFFNAQWPRPGIGTYKDLVHFRWMIFGRNYFGFDHHPLPDNWGVPDVIGAIVDSNSRGDGRLAVLTGDRGTADGQATSGKIPLPAKVNSGEPPTVGVVVNLANLNPSSIALYSRFLSTGRAGAPTIKVLWLVSDSSEDRIPECDYLVIRSGLEKADWVGPLEKETEKLVTGSPDRFVPIARFPIPMPDAEVVVYKCKR